MSGVPRTIDTYSDATPLKYGFVDSRPSAPKTARMTAKMIETTEMKSVIQTPPRMNGSHSAEEARVDLDGRRKEEPDGRQDDDPGQRRT